MALKGPPLVQYTPCGLGVIYFQRTSGHDWMGFLKLALYANLKEADIEMQFLQPIKFFWVSKYIHSNVLSK